MIKHKSQGQIRQTPPHACSKAYSRGENPKELPLRVGEIKIIGNISPEKNIWGKGDNGD